jgi:hypothetical protein
VDTRRCTRRVLRRCQAFGRGGMPPQIDRMGAPEQWSKAVIFSVEPGSHRRPERTDGALSLEQVSRAIEKKGRRATVADSRITRRSHTTSTMRLTKRRSDALALEVRLDIRHHGLHRSRCRVRNSLGSKYSSPSTPPLNNWSSRRSWMVKMTSAPMSPSTSTEIARP